MAERRFTVSDTPLAGLKRVERQRLGDERGFLTRLYDDEELAAAGFDRPIRQINQTLTRRRGSVRGLHFQHAPHAEDKFVSVLAGEVFDVAVDLRRGSPTFLHWHAERLSAQNGRSLFIPRGFAHGFQTLVDDCVLVYLHTERYEPVAEDAVNAFDPMVGINWPLDPTDLSTRDRAHPPLSDDFAGI
jgi:dTDP-4-dehydrorhamnose 3,5-epimerase